MRNKTLPRRQVVDIIAARHSPKATVPATAPESRRRLSQRPRCLFGVPPTRTSISRMLGRYILAAPWLHPMTRLVTRVQTSSFSVRVMAVFLSWNRVDENQPLPPGEGGGSKGQGLAFLALPRILGGPRKALSVPVFVYENSRGSQKPLGRALPREGRSPLEGRCGMCPAGRVAEDSRLEPGKGLLPAMRRAFSAS